MRDLEWEFAKLQARSNEGSQATQANRRYTLSLIARELESMGFRRLSMKGVRRKHVHALVGAWKAQGLRVGTVKNRLACLRWVLNRAGRPGVLPASNAELGIEDRRYVTNVDKGRELEAEKLAGVTDAHVRMSLRLQEVFGLRREEAIKFQPGYADRGERIVLKASWTKGGRPREVPVRTEAQRRVLDEARALAGGGSLIPPGRNYVQQRWAYERQARKVGLDHMHGLRHAYAQRRYQELMGRECPALGGPSRRELVGSERDADSEARLQIAGELGHGRVEIVGVYCGT